MNTRKSLVDASESKLDNFFPDLVELYDAVVFWTWVKCAISFVAGFILGRIL
jgi:hypothetical protein